MLSYIEQVDNDIKNYFKILSKDYPVFLDKYIYTKAMQKQKYISVSCSSIYTNLLENTFFYSSLDHSIAVALIIWNFTHDKKQTLSGLFHDIATPAFKHCVDFMEGDYLNQEATEELTTYFIKNSDDIMKYLEEDGILLSEVDDYHIYPIADNDTPRLSADRLEYTLSNGYFAYNAITLDDIKEFYEDIEIIKNEDGIDELAFKHEDIATKFVKNMANFSVIYMCDEQRFSMQFIADIFKNLSKEGKLTKKDLYTLKESEVIDLIEKSNYKNVFDTWKNATKINKSNVEPKDVYFINHGTKKRYINPMVNGKRIYDISKVAKESIDKVLNYSMNVYLSLNFKL